MPAPHADAPEGTIRIGDTVVRRMGFGAMRITGPDVWGPPEDPARARDVLRRVVAGGVGLIDTADAYGPGTSETLIAEALHPYPAGVIVATKGGLLRPGPKEWRRDASPIHLRAAVEASLQRLRVEAIDLYQLHAVDRKVPFEDSVRTLADLRDDGHLRHVGLCNVTVAQLHEARRIVPIESVQVRYHLRDRAHEDVLRACEALRIAFLPWFPLGAGDLLEDPRLVAVARARRATPAQIALAWLLHRSPVMAPIPGTGDPLHLTENLGAAFLTLTPEETAALEA